MVAIIVAVVGIFASLNLVGTAAESQTRLVLAVVRGIAENYESQTGEPIPHVYNPMIPGDTLDTEFAPSKFSGIERFVYIAKQRPTTRKMLETLPEEVVTDHDGDGADEILDGWGNPLVYFTSNIDGAAEYQSAFMEYRYTYFGSGGLDGDMGNISQPKASESFQRTKDNLYSFELE